MRIELHYFPSIQYMALLARVDRIALEHCENFQKSTYRNRCEIVGPNGLLTLSVPVEGGKDHHQAYRDVRIAGTDWALDHWRSLEMAYRRSAYFEYYEDRLRPFFEPEPNTFLWAHNYRIIQFLCELLEIPSVFELTEKFRTDYPPDIDRRNRIDPRIRRRQLGRWPHSYQQVFEDRQAFVPNLSVLDLLFNEGPSSRSVLDSLAEIAWDC